MPRRKGARGRGGGVRKRGANNNQTSITNDADTEDSMQEGSVLDEDDEESLNDSVDASQGNEDTVSGFEEDSGLTELETDAKSDKNEASSATQVAEVDDSEAENEMKEFVGMQAEIEGGDRMMTPKNAEDSDEQADIKSSQDENQIPLEKQEIEKMDILHGSVDVAECEEPQRKNSDHEVSIEVEEDVQFVDKEADDDEDVQYIDEEADEEQQLLDVMVSTSEDKSEVTDAKDENTRQNISQVPINDKEAVSRTRSSSVKSKQNEDSKFEEISEGSIGQSEQEEVINEASNYSDGALKHVSGKAENEGSSKAFVLKGKTRIPYNEAESLEEVFFATENDDVKITAEDKDNDEISDASLTDHDDANLSLEEISDDDLDVSKKRRKSSGPGLVKPGMDEKLEESDKISPTESESQRKTDKLEKNQDQANISTAQKRSLSDQECITDASTMKKLKMSSEKIDSEEEPAEKDNEPAFFTGICKDPKDNTKAATIDPDVSDNRNVLHAARKLSQTSRNERQGSRDKLLLLRDSIEMRRRYETSSSSTQTDSRQQKGKIVQCNINPIKQSTLSGPDLGSLSDGAIVSSQLDKFRKQLPASIPAQIFTDITALQPALKNFYSFSMGPVTLSDMDSPEFREVVLRRAEKFSLTFDMHSQGIFRATLSKNEDLAILIQQLKRLELGNRYMVMSVTYKHGEGVRSCVWKGTLVFMYEQDIQKEIQGLVTDGKVKAKLNLNNVPKGLSKDFINLLFPEALSVSTGPVTGHDRVVTLGFSSSKMVEEIISCYDLVVLNGSQVSLSELTTSSDKTLESYPEAGTLFTEDKENVEKEKIKDVKAEVSSVLEDDEPGTGAGLPEQDVKTFTPSLHQDAIEEGQSSMTPSTSVLKEETVEKKETPTVSTQVIAKVVTETPIKEAGTLSVEMTDNVKVVIPGNAHPPKSEGDVNNEEMTQSDVDDNITVSVVKGPEEIMKDSSCKVETDANKAMEKSHEDQPPYSTQESSKDLEMEEMEKVLETLPTSLVNLSTNEPRQESVVPPTVETEKESGSVEVRVRNVITADIEKVNMRDISQNEEAEAEKSQSKTAEEEEVAKENLEDVSDEEMLNQSKETDGDDVVIVKEDPSVKVVAKIDLTTECAVQEGNVADRKSKTDDTERIDEAMKQVNKEKRSCSRELPKGSSENLERKLMMTDGSLEISMEVIDVNDNDAEYKAICSTKLQEPIKLSGDRRYIGSDLPISYTKSSSKDHWIASPHHHPRPEPYHSSRSPYKDVSQKGMIYKYGGRPVSPGARVPSRESTAQRRDKFHREHERSRTPSPRKESSWFKESEVYRHPRPRHTSDYPSSSSERKYTSQDNWGKQENWRPSHRGEASRSESYTRTRPENDDRHWEWQEIHSSSHHSSRGWPKESQVSGRPEEHYSYGGSRRPEHSLRKYYSRRSRSRSQSFSDLSMFSDSRSSMRPKPSFERRGPKDMGKHTSRSPISVSSRSHSLSPVSKSPSFERSQPKEDKEELVHSVKHFLHLAKGLHAQEKRRVHAKSQKSPPPPHHSRSPRPMRSYSPRQISLSPPPPPHCHVVRHSPPPRIRTRSPQRKRSRSPYPSWSRNSRSPEYAREQNIRSYRSPSPVDVRRRHYREHHYVSSRGDRDIEVDDSSRLYDSHRSRRRKDQPYERERSRSKPRQWSDVRSSDQHSHSGDRQRQQSYGTYQSLSSSSSVPPNTSTYNPSYPPPGFPHGTSYPPPPQQQSSYLGSSTPMYQYNTPSQYGYNVMPPHVPDPYTVRTQPPPMPPNYQQSYSVMQSTLSGPPPSHSYAPSQQSSANTEPSSSADKSSSSKNKKTWSMGSNAMVFQRILGSDGDKKQKKLSGVIEQIGDRERHERPKQTKEVRVLTSVPVHRK